MGDVAGKNLQLEELPSFMKDRRHALGFRGRPCLRLPWTLHLAVCLALTNILKSILPTSYTNIREQRPLVPLLKDLQRFEKAKDNRLPQISTPGWYLVLDSAEFPGRSTTLSAILMNLKDYVLPQTKLK